MRFYLKNCKFVTSKSLKVERNLTSQSIFLIGFCFEASCQKHFVVMNRQLRLLDNNPDLLRERAREFMKKRDWDRALKCLDRTLQKSSRYYESEDGKPNKQV